MKREWIKESVRDLIALGGIPFLLLVIVRVSLLEKPYFPLQFIIGALVFLFLMFFLKANMHAGLGLIVLIFTSLYYSDLKFSIFASIVYVGLIFSLFYLGKNKKEIFKGILFGAISTGISYFVTYYLF